MTETQKQQNQLAYLLADKLFRATDKFVREHRAINLNGVIGAGNQYLASQFVHAPSKQEALAQLEKDFDIIRGLIEATPENFFGQNVAINLN